MPKPHKNNWRAKALRSLASVLPVAKNRRGKCENCGACCKLPKPCFFLGTRANGQSYCKIHKIKPLVCRKYPQMEHHHVTRDTCGYWFEKEGETENQLGQKLKGSTETVSVTLSPVLKDKIAKLNR